MYAQMPFTQGALTPGTLPNTQQVLNNRLKQNQYPLLRVSFLIHLFWIVQTIVNSIQCDNGISVLQENMTMSVFDMGQILLPFEAG